ncbi:GAF domain-containing protein [Pseudarthrobacter sp. H2]|uniref:GAF domain-containing protein n=1 Tax=Pseudarthrobacter sp. H2 TaxID=3418415 RepID=UPI003CF50FEA
MADRTAADPTGGPPAAILDLVLDSAEVGTFLRSVLAALMADLGGAGRGMNWALAILRAGKTSTWVADSAHTAAIDRIQHSFDDGPALTAMRGGEFVHVGDAGLERRWPGYASAVAGYGVRSLLSVPLVSEGVFAASVNLYAPLPHSFTSEDITKARSYTRQGMRGLSLAMQLSAKKETDAGRLPAPGSRDLVGEALRILMDEYRLSYEAASHYLHTAARRSADLEQAALDIVTAGSPPSPHPDLHDGPDGLPAPARKARPAGRTVPSRGSAGSTA